jgi:hypothetical protein
MFFILVLIYIHMKLYWFIIWVRKTKTYLTVAHIEWPRYQSTVKIKIEVDWWKNPWIWRGQLFEKSNVLTNRVFRRHRSSIECNENNTNNALEGIFHNKIGIAPNFELIIFRTILRVWVCSLYQPGTHIYTFSIDVRSVNGAWNRSTSIASSSLAFLYIMLNRRSLEFNANTNTSL